jgi:hypothetical protein
MLPGQGPRDSRAQALTMTRRSLRRESLPLVNDCRLMTALTKPQNCVLVVAFQHTLQL